VKHTPVGAGIFCRLAPFAAEIEDGGKNIFALQK